MLPALRAPLTVCAVILACITVHETGHALAAIGTGATITEFQVLSLQPHVNVRGPGGPAKNAFRALGGSGLVVGVWFAGMLLVRHAGGVAIQAASFFCSIEVLAWTLSGLLYRISPQTNDAGLFIALSGANPWLVAAAGLGVAVCGGSLYALRAGWIAPTLLSTSRTIEARLQTSEPQTIGSERYH